MFESHLFLGVEIDEQLRKQLLYANPHAIELFINGDATYLQEIDHEGRKFLGKVCGRHQLIEALSLVANNATSLIRKLVPDFSERPFILLAIAKATN
jgi:hypothetical protein